MKKVMIAVLSILLAVMIMTAFQVRETIAHTGVKISAEPVVTTGYIIKMQISCVRSNQTITGVTYELVDDDNINVHIAMDYLGRNEVQEEQTLQLLMKTVTKVHFLVNDQMLDVYLVKDGGMWKTEE